MYFWGIKKQSYEIDIFKYNNKFSFSNSFIPTAIGPVLFILLFSSAKHF